MGEELRIELFGTLRCTVGGTQTPVPAGKPATLLAVLALEAGRTVRTSALVDALWPDDPPPSARALVHTYVSTLRRAIGGSTAVETVDGGYRLSIPPHHVDVHRFLAAAGAADRERWEPELEASSRPVLEGRDLDVVMPWQHRVDDARAELRMRSWRHRVDQGADVPLGELQDAARAHPLREDVTLLLARALAAVGRTQEGVAVLDALRHRLRLELGLDASPALTSLRHQLLAHDRGALRTASAVRPAGAAVPSTGRGVTRPESPGQVDEAPAATSTRGRLARGGVAAVAALGLVGVAGWAVLLQDPVVSGPALVHLDPDGGLVTAIELPVDPSQLHVAGATAWVMSPLSRSVASLPLDGRGRIDVVGLPQPPVSMAADDDSATVALGFSGTVVTIEDGRAGAPYRPFEGSAGKLLLAPSADGPWVATVTGAVHPPPGTAGRAGMTEPTAHPVDLGVHGGRLWVLTGDSLTTSTGTGSSVVSALRGMTEDLAVDRGQAWVVTSGENRIWRADAETGRVVQTGLLPGRPVAVAVAGDRVWVAVDEPAAVVPVDPGTLLPEAAITLPEPPVDLAATPDAVYVLVRDGDASARPGPRS